MRGHWSFFVQVTYCSIHSIEIILNYGIHVLIRSQYSAITWRLLSKYSQPSRNPMHVLLFVGPLWWIAVWLLVTINDLFTEKYTNGTLVFYARKHDATIWRSFIVVLFPIMAIFHVLFANTKAIVLCVFVFNGLFVQKLACETFWIVQHNAQSAIIVIGAHMTLIFVYNRYTPALQEPNIKNDLPKRVCSVIAFLYSRIKNTGVL